MLYCLKTYMGITHCNKKVRFSQLRFYMYAWLTLLPPVIVIVMTITTHNVIISLASGIIVAAAIASNFNPLATLALTAERIVQETHISGVFTGTQLDHLYTCGFLILLGFLIQLMNHSGGIKAYTTFLLTFIKSPRAAQQTSLLLSSTLFIDDYVNNLTVGAIMRPVTDHFNIARAKLAFLLDSMSGPLCLLIPASSWVAFILAQMQSAGIGTPEQGGALIVTDPLPVYLGCMPFLLYPILIVIVAWLVVSYNLSYGTMATFEQDVKAGAYNSRVDAVDGVQFQGSLLDFMLPIFTFIGVFIGAILYSGNNMYAGGTAGFMQTLQQADPFWALFVASIVAVMVTVTLFVYHNPAGTGSIMRAFFDGCMIMKNSLIVLLLAWTLSTLLKNDLQTGTYVASLLPTDISVLYLPAIVFVLCTVISASTGSVWGTIALMLPLTVPLYSTIAGMAVTHLYPLLGALFSGAVAGSHFSPISDAVIMTSCSAGCPPLDHVRTQISYASNALFGALAGYTVLMLIPTTWSYGLMLSVSLSLAVIVTVSLLFLRTAFFKK